MAKVYIKLELAQYQTTNVSKVCFILISVVTLKSFGKGQIEWLLAYF